MPLRELLNDGSIREIFLNEFKKMYRELGEYLFTDTEDDHIIGVFLNKGYFSGVVYNVVFSLEDGFTYERREFGK